MPWNNRMVGPEIHSGSTVRYCGRDFTPADLKRIRALIAEDPQRNRRQLSLRVCQALDWNKPNGAPKEMSCRVALLRMERDRLLRLPPATHRSSNRRIAIPRTLLAEPGPPIREPVAVLEGLALELVTPRTSSLWNEYIDRYHYLGYKKLPGAQLRYFAVHRHRILALFGFGAAAWKVAPRDQFIGWTPEQRNNNLHLVVNNARFLILPWVQSPNLASHLLARVARRLPDDWQQAYSYRPLLLETFVDTHRLRGTCYKAANWTCLGQTQGRGKLDRFHLAALPAKTIWVYPLTDSFRQHLVR